MTVLILERVARSVRGDLSRWLIEVRTGVFVGRVTERVREALWERAVKRADEGSVLMVWRAASEQGFDLRAHQPKGRIPRDYDGMWLMLEPDPNPRFNAAQGEEGGTGIDGPDSVI